MKRLNSDKVYKYIPKGNSEEDTQINSANRYTGHKPNINRRHLKNRFPNHVKNRIRNDIPLQNHYNVKEIYNKCAKCNKQIIDDLSAFYNEEKNEYYCFDCALIEAKKLLNPDPKNKVMYLGAGTFGEIKEIKSEKKFMIIKRIKFSKPKYEKFSINYLPFDQY